ncbi:MAG: sigma 54-interacting transcriptional regulator, partial [Gemmatimonadaceae bacterium]
AIPRDLVESEMFGHERGAFTGATDRRIGRFERAHTGTLFLDEVGDLGLEAQAKLLRAIEAHEIERVGGTKTIRIDVRILAATNKDLARAVDDGSFREDLFFRLNVIPIELPPLRDRPGDLPALVRHFSERHRLRTGRSALAWREDALETLACYRWPGNVRELANVIERLSILHAGEVVSAKDVQDVIPATSRGTGAMPLDQARPISNRSADDGDADDVTDALSEVLPLADALDAYERQLISRALAATAGNVAEAARRLQTDRPNLYRRMRRLGLAVPE